MEATSLDAERAVIGLVLHDQRTLADLDTLRPGHFHGLQTRPVWKLITSMAAKGEPITAHTVRANLNRIPVEERAGIGGVWLIDSMGVAPVSAMAEAYARQIINAADLRALTDAVIRSRQVVDGATDAAEAIELVRSLVDAITPQTVAGSMLADHLYSSIARFDEPNVAIPTPWTDLNRIIGGWRPGGLYVIGARPGAGKALALDTPIPTPTGWSTMGDLKPGDRVIGMDGKPCRVIAATDIMEGRPCYEITFSDGETIIADAQHEWLTETRSSRRAATPPSGYVYRRSSPFSRDRRHLSERPSIKTTKEIARTLRTGSDSRVNHSIPLAEPIELPESDLPIDPYVLGYWLGDGSKDHAQVTGRIDDTQHLIEHLERIGYYWREARRDGISRSIRISTVPIKAGGIRGDSLATRLRLAGLLGNKHIPDAYLRASAVQRRAVLSGIIDSDGHVNKHGSVEIGLTDANLAADVHELALSLGYLAHMRTKRVAGRDEAHSVCYTIAFVPHDNPATLPRKAERVRMRTPRAARRYITDVRLIDSVPVRCIQVDSADHMYLAGRRMIPTHNSIFAIQAALHLAQQGPVAFNTLEMSTHEVNQRIVAHAASVWLSHLQGTGDPMNVLNENDRALIGQAAPELVDLPLSVRDDRSVTVLGIRAHARSLSRHGQLAGIVVDYLQLLRSESQDRRPRHEIVAEYSRGLKNLAGEMNCPVIALSQLNRAAAGGAASLANLRESGALEQDADVVVLLSLPEDKDEHGNVTVDERRINIEVAKNRHGPPGRFTAARFGGKSTIGTRGELT